MTDDDARRASRTAMVAPVLIAIIGLTGIASFVTDSVLWGSSLLLVAVVASLPALALRDRTATVPWPLLAVGALAGIVRVAGVYREAAGYVVIVVLALIVVIELESFTPVELSRRFAVVFSVMVMMALEGLWIIAQSISDRWFGTELLRSQTELQWDIVLVTVLATAVGLLYYGYATRFDQAGSITVPDDEGAR
ncbi:MAG: hypothetical protein ACOC0F_03085 [archaeon]